MKHCLGELLTVSSSNTNTACGTIFMQIHLSHDRLKSGTKQSHDSGPPTLVITLSGHSGKYFPPQKHAPPFDFGGPTYKTRP